MNKPGKCAGHLLFSSLLMFGTIFSFAQESSTKELENNLMNIYDKAFPFYNDDRDSLEYYSNLFTTTLTNFIDKHPETIKYPFLKLKDSLNCSIVTSEDQNFRVYSWDTWLGGTMHIYKNLFQYRSGNSIYTTDLGYGKNEGDIGTLVSAVYTMKANNQTYYVALSGGKTSTQYAYETIQIYRVKGKSLTDKIKLIKTPGGLSGHINVEYDFFSVNDTLQEPMHLIKYDSGRRLIYIPVVLEEGRVSNRYILYRFKGNYFEHN